MNPRYTLYMWYWMLQYLAVISRKWLETGCELTQRKHECICQGFLPLVAAVSGETLTLCDTWIHSVVRGGGKGEKEGKGGRERSGRKGGLEKRSNERWDSWELCIKLSKLFHTCGLKGYFPHVLIYICTCLSSYPPIMTKWVISFWKRPQVPLYTHCRWRG